MERYIALDVHAESTTCAVVSSTGKRLKQVVVETSGSALISFLSAMPGRKHLVLEEGTQSAWLHEILSRQVDELVVAIPAKTAGNKNDSEDAWRLAEQLRTGTLLKKVFKSPELASLRAAVRAYRLLTIDVVRIKNRLKAIFRARGVSLSSEAYDSESRSACLAALPQPSRYQAAMLGQQLDATLPVLEEAEAHLRAEAQKVPSVARVATVPGFGLIRAATLVAATITPARFRTTRQFWSYAGLAIVTRSSSDWIQSKSGWVRGNVNQTRGLNRNRHPWLKDVLKGAALNVTTVMKDHPLRSDYERMLQSGTKPTLARLTIARRLAAAALACWRKQEEYDPSKHKSHIVAVP